jgi:hypothetical protein
MMSRKRRTAGTAVYGTVRTVVGEDGGREPSSYPIQKFKPGKPIILGNEAPSWAWKEGKPRKDAKTPYIGTLQLNSPVLSGKAG